MVNVHGMGVRGMFRDGVRGVAVLALIALLAGGCAKGLASTGSWIQCTCECEQACDETDVVLNLNAQGIPIAAFCRTQKPSFGTFTNGVYAEDAVSMCVLDLKVAPTACEAGCTGEREKYFNLLAKDSFGKQLYNADGTPTMLPVTGANGLGSASKVCRAIGTHVLVATNYCNAQGSFSEPLTSSSGAGDSTKVSMISTTGSVTATTSELGDPVTAAVPPPTGDVSFTGGNCRGEQCPIVIDSVNLKIPAIAAFGTDAVTLANTASMLGTKKADGTVIFPAATLALRASTFLGDSISAISVTPSSDLTGTYDPTSGRLNLVGTMTSGISPLTGSITFNIVGQASARPPVASAGPDQVRACGVSTVTLDGSKSFDPDGDPVTYAWSENGVLLASTRTATLSLSGGVHTILLVVSDSTQRRGLDYVRVAVTDGVAPVLKVPSNKTVSTCIDGADIQIGQATVTDNCSLLPTVTGKVISANGVALVPAPTVVDGKAPLKVGTNVVQWTATDGVNTVTANQTVTVGSTIQASQSFLIDDRGQVRSDAGGFATVLNSGTGSTRIGQDSRSGGIVSQGQVTIQHRALVGGNVVSASGVVVDSDATVSGTIQANTAVALPSLPSLPTFPAPAAAGFTVNSGVTLARPPGSYSVGTVINGGTLILSAGDYYFQSLTINSGSTLRAPASARIFVRDALIFNASIRATSGTSVQPIYLGFGGTTLNMYAPFDGTLVAPNASVVFGTGSGVTFTGSFFGKTLEITPASALVCK